MRTPARGGTPVIYDELNGWQHGDGLVSHDDGESVSDKMASVAKFAITPEAQAVVERPGVAGMEA